MTNVSMKHTIIAKSDQLNADDLLAGGITVKINKVKVTLDKEQPCTIWYEGDNGRPFKPCKGMRKILVFQWGEDATNYIGKFLTLFREPTVKYGGKETGGVEISAMSHIEADFDFAVTVTRGYKKAVRIKKLTNPVAMPHPSLAATSAQAAQPAAQATPATPPPPADPATLTAGSEAAGKGVAAYVAWRDALAAPVKESIRPYNEAWSKIAKTFDAAQPKPEAKMDEEFSV